MCLRFITFTGLLLLTGCSTFGPEEVSKPSNVTLAEAGAETADYLTALKRGLRANHINTGEIVAGIDEHFELTDTAENVAGAQIGIDTSKTAAAGVDLSLGANDQNTANASRGSTIDIHLESVYLANLNCVGLKTFYNSKLVAQPATTLSNDRTFGGQLPANSITVNSAGSAPANGTPAPKALTPGTPAPAENDKAATPADCGLAQQADTGSGKKPVPPPGPAKPTK